MSVANPIGERDVELGSVRNPEAVINTSASLLDNESTISSGSRYTRLIKKIDGISVGFGTVGGICVSGISSIAIPYYRGYQGSIELFIVAGSLAGFFSGIVKCTLERFTFLELSREERKKRIISSIATATIAGFIISLPTGFFFTKGRGILN